MKETADNNNETTPQAANDATPAGQEAAAEAAQPSTEAALKKQIAELEQQLAEMKDKALRAAAEADNTRKRAERDIADSRKFAVGNFAKELVEVAENMFRALEAVPEDQRNAHPMLKSLSEGVNMTLKELLNVFEKYHIKRIHPMGEKFDHNYHQAMMQVPSASHEPGTIVQVLQAGYTLHDRLLRPALVGVATQGEEEQKKVDTTA